MLNKLYQKSLALASHKSSKVFLNLTNFTDMKKKVSKINNKNEKKTKKN